jgi:small subunit ribosomal protein S6
MRQFETLLLLTPEMSGEQRKELLDNLTGLIEREGGKLGAIDEWGIRELAYAVHKQTRGYYVRLEYIAPNQLIAELERIIRMNDGIWKFITVKLDEQAEEEVA